jgi:hypothetical protein
MANLLTKAHNRFLRLLPGQRKLDELIWAQTFDHATRDSAWLIRRTFNPGRWAMGFPGLYILYRILSEARPERILELGLGESSRLTHQYRTFYPDTQLTIVEQDCAWRDTFCRTVFDVGDAVRVLPLKTTGCGRSLHHAYEGLLAAVEGEPYDLVVIDGPWGSRRKSRDQIVELIDAGGLAGRFVLLFDDAERRGEKETIRRTEAALKKLGKPYVKGFYRGAKESCVICSADYRFLTSL